MPMPGFLKSRRNSIWKTLNKRKSTTIETAEKEGFVKKRHSEGSFQTANKKENKQSPKKTINDGVISPWQPIFSDFVQFHILVA